MTKNATRKRARKAKQGCPREWVAVPDPALTALAAIRRLTKRVAKLERRIAKLEEEGQPRCRSPLMLRTYATHRQSPRRPL